MAFTDSWSLGVRPQPCHQTLFPLSVPEPASSAWAPLRAASPAWQDGHLQLLPMLSPGGHSEPLFWQLPPKFRDSLQLDQFWSYESLNIYSDQKVNVKPVCVHPGTECLLLNRHLVDAWACKINESRSRAQWGLGNLTCKSSTVYTSLSSYQVMSQTPHVFMMYDKTLIASPPTLPHTSRFYEYWATLQALLI